jgi:hypothetical protein
VSNSWIIRKPAAWDSLFTFLRGMDLDKPVEVRWGPPRRSNQQNKYLWGVVYKTLAEGLSELHKAYITPDQIHRLCRQYFMPKEDIPGLNKTVDMSTTQLCRSGNEDSFQDYVIQIQQLAAERGIYIADANEPPRD